MPMKNFTSLIILLLIFTTTLTAQNHPFTLTKAGEEPVLYIIHSGRNGGNGGENDYVFVNLKAYNSEGLGLTRRAPTEFFNRYLEQLWYFMEGEDGNIIIKSAYDNGLIAVTNTTDKAKCAKILSEEEATGTYHTWILNNTNGFYAFQTSDQRTYLSHNGNWQTGGQFMGLYNANGSKDEGSRVFIEKAPDGISTNIENIITEAKEKEPIIFSLTGLRVKKITHPGIYIINGKKVAIQ